MKPQLPPPISEKFRKKGRFGNTICKCGRGYGSDFDGLCTRCRGCTAYEAKQLREGAVT